MIRTIIETNALLYIMTAVGMLGILSQLILNRCYRGLIREASDTQAEKGSFMKRIHLQYQTDRKRTNENVNIPVFVRQNIMEYRFKNLTLHQWRRLGGGLFLASMAVAAAGSVYISRTGIAQTHMQHLLTAAAAVAGVSALALLWTDIRYKERCLQTELEDYLYHSGKGVSFSRLEADAQYSRTEAENAYQRAETESFEEEKKAPAIIGIRKGKAKRSESRAQKEKRELQENLSRNREGERETAAGVESTRERNREILRQMDPQEQERIIRDVLAEFLA